MQSGQGLFSTLRENLVELLTLKDRLTDQNLQNLQRSKDLQKAQAINCSENSEAKKQGYRQAILDCFVSARKATGCSGLRALDNKLCLNQAITSEEIDDGASAHSDNLSYVFLDEDNRQSVLQAQALESQKQAGELINLGQAVSNVEENQQILLELIFELDDREITQAALAHIEYVYQGSGYQDIPPQVVMALEARQQDYLYYKVLSDYFSSLLKYMVNYDASSSTPSRGYRNLIAELLDAIDADSDEQVAETLPHDSGKLQLSIDSADAANSCVSGGTYASRFLESPAGKLNQLPGSETALYQPLNGGVALDSDDESAIFMSGGSVVSVGDLVSAARKPEALGLKQRPSPHQRAIAIVDQMLANDDIYEPGCWLTLGSGKLVTELKQVKAKAQKFEAKYQKTTQTDSAEPKVLRDVLRDAGAAGEQKQIALLAEQAFAKLFKYLSWRCLGYDVGGKRWEMQRLINQLRSGEISTEEFILQLSPASQQLKSASAISCSESVFGSSGQLDVNPEENSQPTVYQKLAKETGLRSMSLFRSARHSTTSVSKLNRCLASFQEQLVARRA